MPFIQDAPATPDLYAADRALQLELRRRLPAELWARLKPELAGLGRHTATTLVTLRAQAEAQEPVHLPYDPWGRRVDQIQTSPAWKALKAFSAEHGIVATGHDPALGPHARVAQTAVLHLFSASSAVYSCPLAMTDAAVRVLHELGPEALRRRLLAGLLSRDPATFITSGQWMTERTGGSDVGGTETVARHDPTRPEDAEGAYLLSGVKWFTSATTSEMALTLARVATPGPEGEETVAGSRGLTLFCVEVQRDADGALQGIQVNRLKDKLGTRALPTAELTLDGLRATRLGPVGRGVASISTMLNVTRFYNAVASASGMARAAFTAADYAQRRRAFGRPIAEQPLHARTLAGLAADAAGALAMCMEVASLLGAAEQGAADDAQTRRLRGLVPLAKLTTGKQAVAVASEALEAFGGAGYVEDTGLPALLRDAQVLPIWEGTTNVLSLDLLRAQGKDQAFTAVLGDLATRAAALKDAGLDPDDLDTVQQTLAAVGARLSELSRRADRPAMEAAARRLALATGYAAQAVFLAEAAAWAATHDAHAHDTAVTRFADLVSLRLRGPLG